MNHLKRNEALINARKDIGLTQIELAILMDCQKTTISNWENGYSKPKLTDAFKLANILKKSVDALFLDIKVQDSHTEYDTA